VTLGVFEVVIFIWRWFFCLGYCFFANVLWLVLAGNPGEFVFFPSLIFGFRESAGVCFCLRGTDVWVLAYLTLIGGGGRGFLVFKGVIKPKKTTEK
jgi:hypothetical protein